MLNSNTLREIVLAILREDAIEKTVGANCDAHTEASDRVYDAVRKLESEIQDVVRTRLSEAFRC